MHIYIYIRLRVRCHPIQTIFSNTRKAQTGSSSSPAVCRWRHRRNQCWGRVRQVPTLAGCGSWSDSGIPIVPATPSGCPSWYDIQALKNTSWRGPISIAFRNYIYPTYVYGDRGGCVRTIWNGWVHSFWIYSLHVSGAHHGLDTITRCSNTTRFAKYKVHGNVCRYNTHIYNDVHPYKVSPHIRSCTT